MKNRWLSNKYNRWLVYIMGFLFVGVIISNYLSPWNRFRREPSSTYVELARTCKDLLKQNDLCETNNIFTDPGRYELFKKGVRVKPQNVNFSGRMSKYSLREIIVYTNRVFILHSAGKMGGFCVWTEFLPVDDRWQVEMVVPEAARSYLLWEGDDSEL